MFLPRRGLAGTATICSPSCFSPEAGGSWVPEFIVLRRLENQCLQFDATCEIRELGACKKFVPADFGSSRCSGFHDDWRASAGRMESGSVRIAHFARTCRTRTHSLGTNLSAEQPSVLRILIAVVISTFVSPASIFWIFRIFRPTISARRSWVIPFAIRSRRMFAPSFLSCLFSSWVRGTRILQDDFFLDRYDTVWRISARERKRPSGLFFSLNTAGEILSSDLWQRGTNQRRKSN